MDIIPADLAIGQLHMKHADVPDYFVAKEVRYIQRLTRAMVVGMTFCHLDGRLITNQYKWLECEFLLSAKFENGQYWDLEDMWKMQNSLLSLNKRQAIAMNASKLLLGLKHWCFPYRSS